MYRLPQPRQGGVLHSQAGRQTDSFNRKGNCLSNCRELMSVQPWGCPEAQCQSCVLGEAIKPQDC